MIIVADEAIPAAAELLPKLGELRLLPAGQITAEAVKDADMLLVRSVTRVDAALLASSAVRAVGTATSGTDHIDTVYLESEGIRLHTAKGSNAEAVADYCITALAFLKLQRGLNLQKTRVGIVGMGCTGSAFHRRLLQLGLQTRVCDPPLQAQSSHLYDYSSLAETLACDIVSLHVPLTRGGPHATEGLLDFQNLSLLGEDSALINTSRGGVVNEAHLKDTLQDNPGLQCINDVWQNEPAIDPDLAALVTLATPHIAGYSQQAKRQAT